MTTAQPKPQGLVSRYLGKAGSVASRVVKGVGEYVKEAATSQGQIKAIEKSQASKDKIAQTQASSLRGRYYTPKVGGVKSPPAYK